MALPRIQLTLQDHKWAIARAWTILFIASGVLPIVLYFALRYGAHLGIGTVLAITTSTFGVVSFLALLMRSWALLKHDSECRPLVGSRWAMDYFNWSFLACFASVTALVVAGNVTKSIRLVALGLPVILVAVCGQLLLAVLFKYNRILAPFTISSTLKGQPIRSGTYAITEDVVAVDGGRGQTYRKQLEARYFASHPVRRLFSQLDLLWGISGVAAGGLTIGLSIGLEDESVAYVLGWTVPWAYAAIMAVATTCLVRKSLIGEKEDEPSTLSELVESPDKRCAV
nr:hypothetical protein B0A51_15323 [Rachicladosporium sp. CCFEE 5018]